METCNESHNQNRKILDTSIIERRHPSPTTELVPEHSIYNILKKTEYNNEKRIKDIIKCM